MELKFMEPPTKGRKRVVYRWDRIYQALRENPGEWALLNEKGTVSTYNAVSQGKIKTFHPDMGIEMRTANNDFSVKPRTCSLFVRYTPDLDTSLTAKEREQVWRQIRKKEKEKKMQAEKAAG